SSAPALEVSDRVPDRTRAPARALAVVAPWARSSIRPVSITGDDVEHKKWLDRGQWKKGVASVAAALAIAAMGGTWIVIGGRMNAPAAVVSSQTVAAAPVAPDLPAVTIAPLATPHVSETGRPVAMTNKFTPQPLPPRRAAAVAVQTSDIRPEPSPVVPPASTPTTATSPTPTSSADCTPPYVVDPATGKRQWKLECL
ncbi:MAG: hypothetical protein M3O46_01780, partial [Myxococcota bacterium]|nr:hypothetical protein [Myxococcota bacterium]